MVFSPQRSDDVRIGFKVETYASAIFLIGFQSLASYLTLPAEFIVREFGEQELKHPYYAYICILVGLVICLVVTMSA